MAITVVGSVAFDTVTTPSGRRERMLAGAGTYFALSASFFTDVRVIAVVGEDFTEKEEAVFKARNIDTRGVERAEGKSFFWEGQYLENLNEARAGERYEIDSMYPEFLREAKRHNNTAALLSFQWALEAEKSHARLFSEAIAVLESGWLIAARNFYVCTACGYTSETPESERCPTCNLPWEKFEIVR